MAQGEQWFAALCVNGTLAEWTKTLCFGPDKREKDRKREREGGKSDPGCNLHSLVIIFCDIKQEEIIFGLSEKIFVTCAYKHLAKKEVNVISRVRLVHTPVTPGMMSVHLLSHSAPLQTHPVPSQIISASCSSITALLWVKGRLGTGTRVTGGAASGHQAPAEWEFMLIFMLGWTCFASCHLRSDIQFVWVSMIVSVCVLFWPLWFCIKP